MRVVLFSLLFFALYHNCSWACTCATPPTANVAAVMSDAVFSGTVLSRSRPDSTSSSRGFDEYRIDVDQIWKGTTVDSVSVFSSGSGASCGYDFKPGSTYLIYARESQGQLLTGLCSRNKPLSVAQDDVLALSEVGVTEPTAFDSVVVVLTLASLDAAPEVVKTKLWELQRMGARPDIVFPTLVDLYSDAGTEIRSHILDAVAKLDPGEPAVEFAVRTLNTGNAEVRRSSVGALLRLQEKRPERIAAVVKAQSDPEPSVRAAAAGHYLSDFWMDTAFAEGVLGLLADPDPSVRAHAASALYTAAKRYPSALPWLVAAMDDSSPEVRINAMKAVANFGELAAEGSADAFRRRLRDENEAVRSSAAHWVSHLASHPESEALLEVLRETATDPNEDVRRAATRSLGAFLHHSTSRPVLRELLADPVERIATDALFALASRDRPHEEVVSDLEWAMRTGSDKIRLVAVQRSGQLAREGVDCTHVLVDALEDRDHWVRRTGAYELGKLGARGAFAIPQLRALLNDGDRRVRDQAERAILGIERAGQGGDSTPLRRKNRR